MSVAVVTQHPCPAVSWSSRVNRLIDDGVDHHILPVASFITMFAAVVVVVVDVLMSLIMLLLLFCRDDCCEPHNNHRSLTYVRGGGGDRESNSSIALTSTSIRLSVAQVIAEEKTLLQHYI